MVVRIVLEGGLSDTERLELDGKEPPAHVERGRERYDPVVDYWDRHMRDITGRWRYRVSTPYREAAPGHSAPRVKP